jgi:hypothetical protein
MESKKDLILKDMAEMIDKMEGYVLRLKQTRNKIQESKYISSQEREATRDLIHDIQAGKFPKFYNLSYEIDAYHDEIFKEK